MPATASDVVFLSQPCLRIISFFFFYKRTFLNSRAGSFYISHERGGRNVGREADCLVKEDGLFTEVVPISNGIKYSLLVVAYIPKRPIPKTSQDRVVPPRQLAFL